jgi:hypothetical protein
MSSSGAPAAAAGSRWGVELRAPPGLPPPPFESMNWKLSTTTRIFDRLLPL